VTGWLTSRRHCPHRRVLRREITATGYLGDGTYLDPLACGSIANGTWVHVKGDVQAATGKVLASWVQGK
jgi:hypothetical protein